MPLDITYGVSTWFWSSPFKTESIKELFPKITQAGFDVVEIAIEDPYLIDIEKVKKALDLYGLKAVICGAFGSSRDLTSNDNAVQENCLAYIETCLDFCVVLNARFFAGPMYSAVDKRRIVSADQRKREWERAVKNLRKVCLMAEARNLKIALEPLDHFESDMVNTVEDALRLINDINHPAAKVMLDGFHMNIEETDIEKAIITAGDKLIYMRVSENYCNIRGTAPTQWSAYKKGLEAIQYQGTITIENLAPNNNESTGACNFWYPIVDGHDFKNRLEFLKKWAGEKNNIQHQILKSFANEK